MTVTAANERQREPGNRRERLTDVTRGKKNLPIFLDEYNIGYDFTLNIRTKVGAVYFCMIQGGVVDAGGDMSAV